MACIALCPIVAWPDDSTPPPPPPQGEWTGKGQFGYLSSQGNSDSKSVNANIDMARLDGPWKNEITVLGLYGSNAGIVSAERWETRLQSNREITDALFGFGGLRYEHDLFDGFEYQASVTAGLGYKLINTKETQLTAQLGAGFRRLRPEDYDKAPDGAVIDRIPGDATGEAIATAEVDYSQALTATTTLSNKFLMEAGANDTLLHDNLALTVKMATKLALSVGYGVNDNTHPPGTLKKLDTIETVNLVYSF